MSKPHKYRMYRVLHMAILKCKEGKKQRKICPTDRSDSSLWDLLYNMQNNIAFSSHLYQNSIEQKHYMSQKYEMDNI